MEQVIFGGYYNSLNSTLTEYNTLAGGYVWRVQEYYVWSIVSTDGVIKNLRVRLNAAPGVGTRYTFTLMLNGAPTLLTFDIIGVATTGSNMVNEIVVTGGDYVSIRCVPTGTPVARYATWTSMFEGDNDNESLILGLTSYSLSNLVTEYCQVMSSATNPAITENDFRQVVPTAGTIKNFYVKLNIDPGTPPDAYRLTVRLNGATVAQSLIVTIIANATTGNDLVHNLAVVAGDVLTMMIDPLNTPSAVPWAYWGLTFVATVDGESIILWGSTAGLDRWNTKYNHIVSVGFLGWGVENQRYSLGQPCTLKDLYILLSAAPGAGKKWDFTLRIAGADSNVVITIADAATTGNSGVLEDDVALDEYVDMECDPDLVPDATAAYWGLVCYIEPPPSFAGGVNLQQAIKILIE